MAEDLLGCRQRMFLYMNLFLLIHQIYAQNLLNYNCTNTIGNYTEDSLFQANLYNITSFVPSSPFRFIRRTLGRGVDQVNAVASYWYWGNFDIPSCERCIREAANNLIKVCPNQKEAIGWMDGCRFGYSNKNISGNMSLTPFYMKINSTLATDAYRFSHNLTSLADRLLAKLFHTYDYSVDRYTGVSGNPNGERIYGFMRCNYDVSINDCTSCLYHAKNELLSCCDKVVGASYQTPICVFRFEIYPFFDRISCSC